MSVSNLDTCMGEQWLSFVYIRETVNSLQSVYLRTIDFDRNGKRYILSFSNGVSSKRLTM